MIKEIAIKTNKREEIIDITNRIQDIINESEIDTGCCILFVEHTTAGITINENADPAVKKDILKILDKMIPLRAGYEHAEGNSAAHAKSILTGFSETIFIENKQLILGTWQGIYFCEFDGPRKRKLMVKIVSD
jgi:secondary thiamine-phosphate synthase enzyme